MGSCTTSQSRITSSFWTQYHKSPPLSASKALWVCYDTMILLISEKKYGNFTSQNIKFLVIAHNGLIAFEVGDILAGGVKWGCGKSIYKRVKV